MGRVKGVSVVLGQDISVGVFALMPGGDVCLWRGTRHRGPGVSIIIKYNEGHNGIYGENSGRRSWGKVG